jgi:hypothetical protein
MGNVNASSAAVAMIAAMVTPALLILGSASLIATVMARMARIVDRARVLVGVVNEGTFERLGVQRTEVAVWLKRHAKRARYAELTLLLLYSAVAIFVVTCLSIPIDDVTDHALRLAPVAIAIFGMLFLLVGGALMVAESKLSGDQIAEEIDAALDRLEGKAS